MIVHLLEGMAGGAVTVLCLLAALVLAAPRLQRYAMRKAARSLFAAGSTAPLYGVTSSTSSSGGTPAEPEPVYGAAEDK